MGGSKNIAKITYTYYVIVELQSDCFRLFTKAKYKNVTLFKTHLTRKRFPFRVVPPVHDQLVPVLEHLPADITDVVAGRYYGGPVLCRYATGGGHLLLVFNGLGRDDGDIAPNVVRNVLLLRGSVIRLSRASYLALELAEYFVVGQQLVEFIHVHLDKKKNQLTPKNWTFQLRTNKWQP